MVIDARTSVVALALAPGCISPSVVASSGRAVADEANEIAWRPASDGDLDGLFESIAIEGEVAASLWKVYYHFSSDGSYTGAALLTGDPPRFQTLSGKWSLEGQNLDLGDGQDVRAWVAGDRLKLETAAGVAIFRHAAVQ